MSDFNILNRSIFSFFAIGFRSAFTLIIGILLARSLGPSEYGVFIFLITSLTVLSSLIDFGSTSAFFTFISKKERTAFFIITFFSWKIIQFIFCFLLIYYILPDEWIYIIWQGQNRALILLAFAAVYSQFHIWKTIEKIGEANRATFKVQTISSSFTLLHLILISLLISFNFLSINIIFVFVILEWFIASIIGFSILNLKFNKAQKNESLKNIILEYKIYCLPLIPYILLSIISDFGDTWFLQTFGGSIEQAYYHVAAQLSAISLLATTSILQIFWKEIASANEKNDFEKLKVIYDTSSKSLFIISAAISCFFLPWAKEIILTLLGEKYIDGVNAFLIMLIYPIYQCLGQVNNIMFYSLEYTKQFAKISSIWLITSFLTSYLLLAPNNFFVPGLSLGSIGLAIKMVLLQFMLVFYTSYWITKKYNWKLEFFYQIMVITISLFISITLKLILYNLLHEIIGLYLTFLISGVAYLLILCSLFLYVNKIFFINNTLIEHFFISIKTKVNMIIK